MGSSPSKQLFRAAEDGDQIAMEAALAAGAALDTRQKKGYTPLIIASKRGRLGAVEWLLRRGAADLRDKYNRSALHHAAAQNQLAIVGLLLARGSDIWALDVHGRRPVDVAMDEKHTNVVRLFEERCCPFRAFMEQRHSRLFGMVNSTERVWLVVHRARTFDNPAVDRNSMTAMIFEGRDKPRPSRVIRQPRLRLESPPGDPIIDFTIEGSDSRDHARLRAPRPMYEWLCIVLSADFGAGRGPGIDPRTRTPVPPPWMSETDEFRDVAASTIIAAEIPIAPPMGRLPTPAAAGPAAATGPVAAGGAGAARPTPAFPPSMERAGDFLAAYAAAPGTPGAIPIAPPESYRPPPTAPGVATGAASVHDSPMAAGYGGRATDAARAWPLTGASPSPVTPMHLGRPGAASAASSASSSTTSFSVAAPPAHAMELPMDVNLDDAPVAFLCPITMEVMRDPVVASDGHTYERAAMLAWLEGGHRTSPKTNAVLPDGRLLPNFTLRSQILEWCEIRQRDAANARRASALVRAAPVSPSADPVPPLVALASPVRPPSPITTTPTASVPAVRETDVEPVVDLSRHVFPSISGPSIGAAPSVEVLAPSRSVPQAAPPSYATATGMGMGMGMGMPGMGMPGMGMGMPGMGMGAGFGYGYGFAASSASASASATPALTITPADLASMPAIPGTPGLVPSPTNTNTASGTTGRTMLEA